MLNLLTAILDLRKTKSSRRAFQEVAQRRKLCKIAFFTIFLNQRLWSALYFEIGSMLPQYAPTYSASSIFLKVCSACSKNPNTMDRLNSRSSSSSSISRICSNVKTSMLSPRSGRPTEPSSLCNAHGQSTLFALCGAYGN